METCAYCMPHILSTGTWIVNYTPYFFGWNHCWNRLTFVIGFLLLLTGAALNDQRGEESVYFGYYYCYVVKPGVFTGGAILSLASAAFGILYYISLTERKNGSQYPYPNQGVIAMAQPQIPSQTSQEPVFVHEDTYIRRQFTWLCGGCFNQNLSSNVYS